MVYSYRKSEIKNICFRLFHTIGKHSIGWKRYSLGRIFLIGRLHEMSSAIRRMLRKYKAERIIEMPYTIENFRQEIVDEALDYMTPDDVFRKFTPDDLLKRIPPQERLKGLSTEEVFKAFFSDEIEAYLKKLQKKTKTKKKTRTAD